MLKRILLTIITFAILLPFQNCDYAPSAKSQFKVQAANSGQPYDGKPFIINAACADGTRVESRILMKDANSGTLFRENCRSIAPRDLSSDELRISADEVVYAGKNYKSEVPAIPLPGVISWFYQLTGILQPRPASIYIIEMFDNDSTAIQSLKQSGHTVICSISAGTFESWQPDANRFSARDKGNRVAGGSGESWLDTRSANVRSIMLERLDLARDKGCQGIDFDNVDAYDNDSGFNLSKESQLEYNQYLAFAAHDRELILTLNNAPDLAESSANIFDIAISEECFRFNECDKYRPFVARGKPVLNAEYTALSTQQCSWASSALISLAYFNRELDGSRYETCQ